MRTLIIGTFSCYVESFRDWTKEDFIKVYASQGIDVSEAWQIIQEELNKLQDVREPKKKGK
jgi:hypothetical protein